MQLAMRTEYLADQHKRGRGGALAHGTLAALERGSEGGCGGGGVAFVLDLDSEEAGVMDGLGLVKGKAKGT